MDSVAQVKVKAFKRTQDANGEWHDTNKYDMDSIKLAATHFLQTREDEIKVHQKKNKHKIPQSKLYTLTQILTPKTPPTTPPEIKKRKHCE